jgi:uncharacterized tellurite resistance protein B-like protein
MTISDISFFKGLKMADRNLVMTLAKVLIAAAWADGEVTAEEINSVKDLLFHLPHVPQNAPGMRLSSQEWTVLEMYMESPVAEAERTGLVNDLQEALRSPEDKSLALAMLTGLVQADGVVSAEETAVLQEIRAAIQEADTGLFSKLGRLFGGAVQKRSDAYAPNREQHYDDFVKNKVYFAVQQRLQATGQQLNLADADLRKYSLAGALMAQVAHLDRVVTDEERAAMVAALQARWGVAEETAVFITEVALSQVNATLDTFRMQREFTTSTSEAERERFVELLFVVAGADGQASFDETEEIRRLAMGLNLSHTQFIDAKLRAKGTAVT